MKIRFLILLFTVLFLTSCGSKKKIATVYKDKRTEKKIDRVDIPEVKTLETPSTRVVITPVKTYDDVKRNYIEQYHQVAIQEMSIYKIPASITLAQGVLESRSGTSELTTRSNNHFGIKCHKGWKGRKTYHDDDEKGECFRVYKNPINSFRDHSLFLTLRKRYEGLFELKITDYKRWAKGLKKAGYATDNAYPQKLITIIEEYELYKYDAMALGKKVEKIRVKEVNIPLVEESAHIVQKGDTLYSISRQYNISIDVLKELNSLQDNTISIGQKLLIANL
jgi:flagellum-specific peptidoglycan hydrolase FlgJ